MRMSRGQARYNSRCAACVLLVPASAGPRRRAGRGAAQAAGSRHREERRGADARRRGAARRRLSAARRGPPAGAAAAHARTRRTPARRQPVPSPGRRPGSSWSCRTRADATCPTASPCRTTRAPTATTRSSGWRRCPTWTAASGMFGGSYSATVQLLAAPLRPPHLVALFPSASYASRYDMVFQGGAFYLGDGLGWNLGQAKDVAPARCSSRQADRDGEIGLIAGGAEAAADASGTGSCRSTSIEALQLRRYSPGYFDLLAHPSYDAFWTTFDVAARHPQFEVPAYHLTGWYDSLLNGTLANFTGLRANAGTERARRNQRLIVGPWTHARPTRQHDEDRRRGLRPRRRLRLRGPDRALVPALDADWDAGGDCRRGRRGPSDIRRASVDVPRATPARLARRAGAAVPHGREPLARRAGVAAARARSSRRSSCAATAAPTASTATAGSIARRPAPRPSRPTPTPTIPPSPCHRPLRRLLAHARRPPRDPAARATCSSTPPRRSPTPLEVTGPITARALDRVHRRRTPTSPPRSATCCPTARPARSPTASLRARYRASRTTPELLDAGHALRGA